MRGSFATVGSVWAGGIGSGRTSYLMRTTGPRNRTHLPETSLPARREPVASGAEVSYGVTLGMLRAVRMHESSDPTSPPRSKRIESRPVEPLCAEADRDAAGRDARGRAVAPGARPAGA